MRAMPAENLTAVAQLLSLDPDEAARRFTNSAVREYDLMLTAGLPSTGAEIRAARTAVLVEQLLFDCDDETTEAAIAQLYRCTRTAARTALRLASARYPGLATDRPSAVDGRLKMSISGAVETKAGFRINLGTAATDATPVSALRRRLESLAASLEPERPAPSRDPLRAACAVVGADLYASLKRWAGLPAS